MVCVSVMHDSRLRRHFLVDGLHRILLELPLFLCLLQRCPIGLFPHSGLTRRHRHLVYATLLGNTLLLSPTQVLRLSLADDVELALDDDAVHPSVVYELGRLGALIRIETKHGRQERRDQVRVVSGKQVLVAQYGVERPETELGDVPKFACVAGSVKGMCTGKTWDMLTFAVEKLGRVLAARRDILRKLADKLNNLCNVVVVLAVPRARGRVEQIVSASKEFKDLEQE